MFLLLLSSSDCYFSNVFSLFPAQKSVFKTKSEGKIHSPQKGNGIVKKEIHVCLTRTGLEGRLVFAEVFDDTPSHGNHAFSNNLENCYSGEPYSGEYSGERHLIGYSYVMAELD